MRNEKERRQQKEHRTVRRIKHVPEMLKKEEKRRTAEYRDIQPPSRKREEAEPKSSQQ
jgi:hypothetical protein